MSAPIPIQSSSPPSSHPLNPGHQPSYSTSSTTSTVSDSMPQTPFSPTYSLSSTAPPATAVPATAAGGSSILKWASGFSNLSKSPSKPLQSPNLPTVNGGGGGGGGERVSSEHGFGGGDSALNDHDHDHDHDEHHDVFEFGDVGHLNSSSWTGHGRRAMSMSVPGPAGGSGGTTGAGGISSLLSGFGAAKDINGGAGAPGGVPSLNVGSPPGTGFGMGGPMSGVVADNAARGQGLLRRLSLTGGRPSLGMLSPTSTSTSLVPPPPTPAVPLPTHETGLADRGRRFSEAGPNKKRSVSPMGERLLRDHHSHF